MTRLLLPLVSLCLSGPALAQEGDPMEQQRCVWACLANSPGAESREYSDCVAQYCEAIGMEEEAAAPEAGMSNSQRPQSRPVEEAAGGPPPMPVQEAAPTGWAFGPGAGGVGMYAGIADPATGRRIDWLCAKGRQSMLALSPYDGAGKVVFTVDGRVREVDLTVEGGVGYAPIGFADPLFLHIGSGPAFTVSEGGAVLGSFSMMDAPVAIGQAEGRCR